VLTPLLLANEEKAVEKEVKEIQIVFKEIGREAAERRSIIVKRRTPMANKSNKNDSMITHNDSYSAEIIANDIDEHSQAQLKEDTVDIINNNHVEKEEEEEEPTSSLNRSETAIKPVEITEDQLPPRSTSPTSMIVSQSNHYNYSTKNKQQQLQQPHQATPVNSFHGSTNMTYSFNNSVYPYRYPSDRN
ncbi:unnamed protein product, partial [Adineta ricciae]